MPLAGSHRLNAGGPPSGARPHLFSAGNFSPRSDNHCQMGAARSELLHDLPDDDLVRRAQAGEREAFAEIYRRYHAVVYRFARMMSGSLAIGEDITQETFTVLLRDLHRYKTQRSSISPDLYGGAWH